MKELDNIKILQKNIVEKRYLTHEELIKRTEKAIRFISDLKAIKIPKNKLIFKAIWFKIKHRSSIKYYLKLSIKWIITKITKININFKKQSKKGIIIMRKARNNKTDKTIFDNVQKTINMSSEQRRQKYKLQDKPIKNIHKAFKKFQEIEELDHQVAFIMEVVYDTDKFLSKIPYMRDWVEKYSEYI